MVESLLRLIGLDWVVPDFSPPSRRQKTLKLNPYRGSQGARPRLMDIAPVSATASSEPARGHQGRGRRGVERPQAWRHEAARSTSPVGFGPMAPPLATPRTNGGQGSRRKIHIAIAGKTLEIRAAGRTTSAVGDAPMLPGLLDRILPDPPLASVTADGAFDPRKCHDAIAARGATAIIPPRKTARPWQARLGRGRRAQRGLAHIQTLRPDDLATMERLAPPKPRRNMSRARKQS